MVPVVQLINYTNALGEIDHDSVTLAFRRLPEDHKSLVDFIGGEKELVANRCHARQTTTSGCPARRFELDWKHSLRSFDAFLRLPVLNWSKACSEILDPLFANDNLLSEIILQLIKQLTLHPGEIKDCLTQLRRYKKRMRTEKEKADKQEKDRQVKDRKKQQSDNRDKNGKTIRDAEKPSHKNKNVRVSDKERNLENAKNNKSSEASGNDTYDTHKFKQDGRLKNTAEENFAAPRKLLPSEEQLKKLAQRDPIAAHYKDYSLESLEHEITKYEKNHDPLTLGLLWQLFRDLLELYQVPTLLRDYVRSWLIVYASKKNQFEFVARDCLSVVENPVVELTGLVQPDTQIRTYECDTQSTVSHVTKNERKITEKRQSNSAQKTQKEFPSTTRNFMITSCGINLRNLSASRRAGTATTFGTRPSHSSSQCVGVQLNSHKNEDGEDESIISIKATQNKSETDGHGVDDTRFKANVAELQIIEEELENIALLNEDPKSTRLWDNAFHLDAGKRLPYPLDVNRRKTQYNRRKSRKNIRRRSDTSISSSSSRSFSESSSSSDNTDSDSSSSCSSIYSLTGERNPREDSGNTVTDDILDGAFAYAPFDKYIRMRRLHNIVGPRYELTQQLYPLIMRRKLQLQLQVVPVLGAREHKLRKERVALRQINPGGPGSKSETLEQCSKGSVPGTNSHANGDVSSKAAQNRSMCMSNDEDHAEIIGRVLPGMSRSSKINDALCTPRRTPHGRVWGLHGQFLHTLKDKSAPTTPITTDTTPEKCRTSSHTLNTNNRFARPVIPKAICEALVDDPRAPDRVMNCGESVTRLPRGPGDCLYRGYFDAQPNKTFTKPDFAGYKDWETKAYTDDKKSNKRLKEKDRERERREREKEREKWDQEQERHRLEQERRNREKQRRDRERKERKNREKKISTSFNKKQNTNTHRTKSGHEQSETERHSAKHTTVSTHDEAGTQSCISKNMVNLVSIESFELIWGFPFPDLNSPQCGGEKKTVAKMRMLQASEQQDFLYVSPLDQKCQLPSWISTNTNTSTDDRLSNTTVTEHRPFWHLKPPLVSELLRQNTTFFGAVPTGCGM